jgi:hypothetical protein
VPVPNCAVVTWGAASCTVMVPGALATPGVTPTTPRIGAAGRPVVGTRHVWRAPRRRVNEPWKVKVYCPAVASFVTVATPCVPAGLYAFAGVVWASE